MMKVSDWIQAKKNVQFHILKEYGTPKEILSVVRLKDKTLFDIENFYSIEYLGSSDRMTIWIVMFDNDGKTVYCKSYAIIDNIPQYEASSKIYPIEINDIRLTEREELNAQLNYQDYVEGYRMEEK